MPLKLDLHIHTRSRGKTYIDSHQLRQALKKRRLDGTAVTNFFDIAHAAQLKDELKEYAIIVGQEIWTKEGHIIGLGLKEKIRDFLSAQKTVAEIHSQGGIAVAVHPYTFLGTKEKWTNIPIDAIETYNALVGYAKVYNYMASKAATRYGIPQVTGTDTTCARYIGYSYTEVLTDDKNEILTALKTGKVKLHKRALPVPLIFIAKNFLNVKNIEPCDLHATPCFICGKSMAIRTIKKKYACLDCGKVEYTRILCSNGHYICLPCTIKREEGAH